MTNQVSGSSLLQARNSHLHHRHSHLHLHHHHHPEPVDARSQQGDLHDRDEPAAAAALDSAVTEVVQTVSVVQVIDGSGATVSVQTLWYDPQTNLVDPSTGVTLDASSAGVVTPTLAVPAASSVTPDAASLTTSLAASLTTSLASSLASSPASSPASSLNSSSAAPSASSLTSQTVSVSLTAAPLTTSSSLFPSLSSASNSTASSIASYRPFGNGTALHSLFPNSTATSSRSSSTSFSSSYTSTRTSSTRTSTSASTSSDLFATAVATGDVGSGDATGSGGGGGGGGVTATAPAATAVVSGDADPSDQDSNTPQLVGGVVGGVAGLAILLLIAMMLLRWKKRRGAAQPLLGPPSEKSGFRSLTSSGGPRPPSSPGGAPAAAAERTFPFAVPATLASLTGKRFSGRGSTLSGSEPGEKGFHRVSGKKLPSVLQYGGDGFSDPRASTVSGASSYRDSMAFFNQMGTPGTQRFAVGSPMRPESGVPVIHPGAARTPVTELGPYLDLPPTPPANPNGPDPLGRSLISQDSSRASRSRFSENI